MVVGTLALAAVVDLAIAALLAYVGVRITHRAHAPEMRRAAAAFAVWWFALAFTVLANGAREAAAALGIAAAPLVLAIVPWFHAAYIAALVLSVWGILYYLVYLFTGRDGWFWPISALYAVYAGAALAISTRMQPDGLVAGPWFVQWHYATPQLGAPLLLVMVLLLLVPQLAAAVAYGTLARRTEDPIARRRVLVVSAALTIWLGSALFAPFLQLGRFEWWQAGGRLVGLAASIAILYAYAATPHTVRALSQPRLADDALAARLQDLV